MKENSKVEVYDPEHRINKPATKRIKESRGFLKGMDTHIDRDDDRYFLLNFLIFPYLL